MSVVRNRNSAAGISGRIAVFFLPVLVISCGVSDNGENETTDCPREPINTNLVRLLYWGLDDDGNQVPNRGTPLGNIKQPIWTSDGQIYVLSQQLVGGVLTKGIFEVNFHNSSLTLDSVISFEFEQPVWSFKYDPDTNKFAVLYFGGDSNIAAGLAVFRDGEVVLEQALIPAEWQPAGIELWQTKPGAVFYGRNPESQIAGFYCKPDLNGGGLDSLLFPVVLTADAARGFSISKNDDFLFYGLQSGTGFAAVTQILMLDLSVSEPEATVIIERNGSFLSLSCNPAVNDLVLLNYHIYGDYSDRPGTKLELLNYISLESTLLDVRTSEALCRYVLAESPCWSPDGGSFVFSGSSFDSEGGVRPFTIWTHNSSDIYDEFLKRGREQ